MMQLDLSICQELIGLSFENRLTRRLIQHLQKHNHFPEQLEISPESWQNLLMALECRESRAYAVDLTGDKPALVVAWCGHKIRLTANPDCPEHLAFILQ